MLLECVNFYKGFLFGRRFKMLFPVMAQSYAVQSSVTSGYPFTSFCIKGRMASKTSSCLEVNTIIRTVSSSQVVEQNVGTGDVLSLHCPLKDNWNSADKNF